MKTAFAKGPVFTQLAWLRLVYKSSIMLATQYTSCCIIVNDAALTTRKKSAKEL